MASVQRDDQDGGPGDQGAGLATADGQVKPALEHFDNRMGLCQWFHFEDHRLDYAVELMKALGVKELRTGLSWADWHRPDAAAWFDRQMQKLEDFDVTLTFCFTPPSLGRRACHASPPVDLEEFARFATEMVRRYVLREAFDRTAGPERPAGVVASNRGEERNHYEQNQDRNRRTRQLCEQPAPRH